MVFHAGKYTIVPRIPIKYAFPCVSCHEQTRHENIPTFPLPQQGLLFESPNPSGFSEVQIPMGSECCDHTSARPGRSVHRPAAKCRLKNWVEQWDPAALKPLETNTPETETPLGGSQIFWSSSRDRQRWLGFFLLAVFFAGVFFFCRFKRGFWFGSATKPGVSVEKDTDSFYFCWLKGGLQ